MKFIAINKTNQRKLLTWAEMMLPQKKCTTRNPRSFDILQICQKIVTVY